MTGVLRKRFFGDTVLAQRFTGEGLSLLEQVHAQMELGGIQQYELTKNFGGVEVRAVSRFGQDEIQIRATTPVPKPRGGGRAYCVWENDEDLFTDPMGGTYIQGPHTAGQDIQFGGQIATADNVSTVVINTLTPSFEVSGSFNVSLSGIPNGGDVILRQIEPDIKSNLYIAPYFSQLFATQTIGFGYWGANGAQHGQYTEVDRVTNYPSSTVGGYFWQSVLYGYLGYQHTSRGTTYNTFSAVPNASGPVEATISPNPMRHASTGDAFYIAQPGGTRDNIYKLGIVSGVYADMGFPAEAGNLSQWDYVIQNDGDTVWLLELVFGGSDFTEFKLYRGSFSRRQWEKIEVENGWPNSTQAVNNVIRGISNTGQVLPIQHDPITDTICVVKADYTGAWIFNGKDCFNVPLGPIYRKFESDQPPIDLSGTYNYATVVQFFNGRIYIRYGQFIRDLATVHAHEYTCTGASYKVGRILQKKQTNVE